MPTPPFSLPLHTLLPSASPHCPTLMIALFPPLSSHLDALHYLSPLSMPTNPPPTHPPPSSLQPSRFASFPLPALSFLLLSSLSHPPPLSSYDVVLENHGEIEAEYWLDPSDSPFSSRFKFSPTKGLLAPREQVAYIYLSP